jgi:uncharacterized membrane protein (DUF373 family)
VKVIFMEKNERKLLDVAAAGSIVIAIGTLGVMVTMIIDDFGEGLMPKSTVRAILIVLTVIALYFTISSLIEYHSK